MRISLIAIGRLGRSAEAGLVEDYLNRASLQGRALGIGPAEQIELEARKSDPQLEAGLLLPYLTGSQVIACDEHGSAWTSRELAGKIGKIRDQGARKLCFVVGGAAGLDPSVLQQADHKLAFGPQTWPHALARVMVSEQIYRAVTILAGSPYHRD